MTLAMPAMWTSFAEQAMHAWQAIVLGVVEGVSEFLPISSTGHLILAQRALGLANDEAAKSYAICIQAGAILAVLAIYMPRVAQMMRGVTRADPAGRRLIANVIVAFLPAAVVGVLFEKTIDRYLFGLWPVVAAWFVGGVAILSVAALRVRGSESRPAVPTARSIIADIDAMSWRPALAIGAWQCLALWPGTSRSLVTIAGGVLAGLTLSAAVEFSLVLGLVTLLAATAFKALHGGKAMLAEYGAMSIALGFVAAFVFAWLSVRWMVGYLKSHGMAVFGWYRVILAIAVSAAIADGIVRAT
jgi:undecaprenyl-diphosphatase